MTDERGCCVHCGTIDECVKVYGYESYVNEYQFVQLCEDCWVIVYDRGNEIQE